MEGSAEISMIEHRSLVRFAPPFAPDTYSEKERKYLAPFFTNLDKSVYVPLIASPELIGALCSRTSRAAGDLRYIFLHEFVYPFVAPVRGEKETEDEWQEKVKYGKSLKEFISLFGEHSIADFFSHPRARSFYIKWLAQYGDDSIAQMAGLHLVFAGLSQVAIKHCEDQRIGLAPIEKSTRYVNYSVKISGQYPYYVDPALGEIGLLEEYRMAMDNLFDTYTSLLPRLIAWLSERFPEETLPVIEKKAFDTLRGLLPTSTISQVSFFGNGQAFEYLINRSAAHPLGEIQWAAERAFEELHKVAPSFLWRLKDEDTKEIVETYQRYLAEKPMRMKPLVDEYFGALNRDALQRFETHGPRVRLAESDPDGEVKVITAMLYGASGNHRSWSELLEKVRQMSQEERKKVIDTYLRDRTQRWQKVGRAFEHVYNRFEIVMNIGAWRDLHRHRMLTQQRQYFSCHHGYDVPQEIVGAGLEQEFRQAIDPIEELFSKIESKNNELAQYAVTLSHRIRFMQWENLRQSFWQIELRTIPEGHPDYRKIEQEKFKLLKEKYPLIASHIRANMADYDFARRGQEEKVQEKLAKLSQ